MTPPRTIDVTNPRMLPALTDENRAYWTGGAEGELRLQFCPSCDRWVHPPVATCPDCGGASEARAVTGSGTIFSYTINHQAFAPNVPTPYNIAIVELDEDPELRIITNIIGCADEDLAIGMPVRVVFEDNGEIFVPLFEPG